MNRPNCKTNENIIAELVDIKKSIIAGADDVLWMHNRVNETVCERIDAMIIALTETDGITRPALRDELESHYSPPPSDDVVAHARAHDADRLANIVLETAGVATESDPIADARAAGTHDAMASVLGLPTKRELVEQMVADAGGTPPTVPWEKQIEIKANANREKIERLCDEFKKFVMDSTNGISESFDEPIDFLDASMDVFVDYINDAGGADYDKQHPPRVADFIDNDGDEPEDIGRNGWKIDGRGDE